MQLTVASRSETGPVRHNNEDFVAFWEPEELDEKRERGALAIIADGVGGYGHGEVASRLAVETALQTFRTIKGGGSMQSILAETVNQANLAVYDASMANRSAEGRMQTTLTAVILRNDQIGVAHVGDCRVYHIHKGTAQCLTTDHTQAAIHDQVGLLDSGLAGSSPLRGGLTRSVGKDPIVAIDFSYAEVHASDYIVQCTDGVHPFITEGELVEIVTHATPAEACQEILRLCEARGTEDNITVQICRIDRVQQVGYYRGVPIYRESDSMGHELEVGDVLDDRFEIVQVISRSGMASIFEAFDRELGQRVALKVPFMQYESDPAFFSRFQREEEIGRLLNHPGILKIIPVDEDKKSRPYIAMELLSGPTLDQVMRQERPMHLPKAVDIVVKVCDALAYMHEKNVVHRDLKPTNIMLCDDGSLRIMDFGIAKAAAMRRITFTGFSPAMGTPDYMAPEQVKGRRGDHRTDIYSLGAILYELATGHTPFEGQNPFMIMQARITGDPEAPTNLNPAISPQLEEIILHAMEREPRNRYASAREMEADLMAPDRVVLTGRVDRLQRPRAWRSRHARYYIGLVLIPLAVIVGILLITWLHR